MAHLFFFFGQFWQKRGFVLAYPWLCFVFANAYTYPFKADANTRATYPDPGPAKTFRTAQPAARHSRPGGVAVD